jgi:hypothetical protein
MNARLIAIAIFPTAPIRHVRSTVERLDRLLRESGGRKPCTVH